MEGDASTTNILSLFSAYTFYYLKTEVQVHTSTFFPFSISLLFFFGQPWKCVGRFRHLRVSDRVSSKRVGSKSILLLGFFLAPFLVLLRWKANTTQMGFCIRSQQVQISQGRSKGECQLQGPKAQLPEVLGEEQQ